MVLKWLHRRRQRRRKWVRNKELSRLVTSCREVRGLWSVRGKARRVTLGDRQVSLRGVRQVTNIPVFVIIIVKWWSLPLLIGANKISGVAGMAKWRLAGSWRHRYWQLSPRGVGGKVRRVTHGDRQVSLRGVRQVTNIHVFVIIIVKWWWSLHLLSNNRGKLLAGRSNCIDRLRWLFSFCGRQCHRAFVFSMYFQGPFCHIYEQFYRFYRFYSGRKNCW